LKFISFTNKPEQKLPTYNEISRLIIYIGKNVLILHLSFYAYLIKTIRPRLLVVRKIDSQSKNMSSILIGAAKTQNRRQSTVSNGNKE
jgi:hypothetical protein